MQPASFSGIESLSLSGNLTALVDGDSLTGFSSISLGATPKLVTSETALNLTGISVSGSGTIESSNAGGTTFLVDNKAAAFRVFGGIGSDTLQTTGLTFDELERDQIFATTSIETIIDGKGTWSLNEPPVLTGDLSATVAEGATYQITTDDLNYSDPDDGPEDVTFTVANFANGEVLLDGASTTSFTGQNILDGLVSFSHDGSETTSASFGVYVEDGDEDGSLPVAQPFAFYITPVNDPAVIDGSLTGSVIEDLILAVNGSLTVSDVDSDETFIASFQEATYGSLNLEEDGNWTYTLANAHPEVQALGAGETLTDVITIQSFDETEQSITITIDGSDEAPGKNNATPTDGTTGDDTLYGDDGSDSLSGGDGNDQLFGGDGRDVLTGDAGNDTLSGGADNDELAGGTGSDLIDGGIGKDVLTGGDKDVVTGDGDTDIFVFDFDGFKDTVTDFEVGVDLIQISGVTSDYFELLTITEKKGEVIITSPDGDQMILANIDDPTLITQADFDFIISA